MPRYRTTRITHEDGSKCVHVDRIDVERTAAYRYLNDAELHAKVYVVCRTMGWVVPHVGEPNIRGVDDAVRIIDALDDLAVSASRISAAPELCPTCGQPDNCGDCTHENRPAGCACGRPARGLTCRCTCDRCGGRRLQWVPVGHYLDKNLECLGCGHTQDIWDC